MIDVSKEYMEYIKALIEALRRSATYTDRRSRQWKIYNSICEIARSLN